MVDSETVDFAQVLPFCSIHYLQGFCGVHHFQDMAYAMYKFYLYESDCGIHHLQVWACGIQSTSEIRTRSDFRQRLSVRL